MNGPDCYYSSKGLISSTLEPSLICAFFKQGYKNVDVSGECCGKCVQTSCVFEVPGLPSPVVLKVSTSECKDAQRVWESELCHVQECIFINSTPFLHIWQPSESWSPPNDNCTTYDCQKIKDDFIILKNKTTCPEFDPNNCIPVSTLKQKHMALGAHHICSPFINFCIRMIIKYAVTTIKQICKLLCIYEYGCSILLNSLMKLTYGFTCFTGNWEKWCKWLLHNL